MKKLIFFAVTLLLTACSPDNLLEDTDKAPVETPGDNSDDKPGESGGQPGNGTETQPEETVIFYDDLDKAPTDGSWLDRWNGYINAEGIGAANVSYTGSYIKTRNSFVSTGYPGASGENGFYCSATSGTTLSINDIRLHSNGTGKYVFSAGFNVYIDKQNKAPDDYVSINVTGDGFSANVEYTTKQYDRWYYLTGEFHVDEAVPQTVSIQIKLSTSGIGIDDPKLVWYGKTDEDPSEPPAGDVEPDPVVLKTPYFEYPETLKPSKDYVYGTLRGKTYRSQKDVRNYSYCYDVRRHNPIWVAYPCHEIYWEGGYTRPNPDPWRPNPDLTEQQQSVIYAKDWNNWPWNSNSGKPTDSYNYWTYTNTSNVMLSKGHMMRSAERGAGKSNVLFGMNEQSFYPTNINPERDRYVEVPNGSGKFNLSHWSIVEYVLSNDWRCSDTLYVVVGCWYDKDQHEAVDASNWGARSSKSKVCKVSAARYKAILRTKKGNTGKRISDCSADELMSIAFWFPQCFEPGYDNKKTSIEPLSNATISVAELEKRIGGDFSFFPDAPEKAKESFNTSHWPGLDDVINDPLNSSFDLNQIFGY